MVPLIIVSFYTRYSIFSSIPFDHNNNGVVEEPNNLIKHIKYTEHNYSNFSHLRAKIFIINRLTVKPIQNKKIAEATLLPDSNIHLSA